VAQQMSQSGPKPLTRVPHAIRDQILSAMEIYPDPVSPTFLSRALRIPLARIAYHMRILHKADAIDFVGTRRGGGGEVHLYRLNLDPRELLATRMPQLLSACGALAVTRSGENGLGPIVLDDEARLVLADVLRDIKPLVKAIVAASTARVVEDDALSRAHRARAAANAIRTQLDEVAASITAGQAAKRTARTLGESRSASGAIRALTQKQKAVRKNLDRADQRAAQAEADHELASLLRVQDENTLSNLLPRRRACLPIKGAK
jgi:hypothetical protein